MRLLRRGVRFGGMALFQRAVEGSRPQSAKLTPAKQTRAAVFNALFGKWLLTRLWIQIINLNIVIYFR